MSFKLHTVNIAGNLHLAATTVNAWGWAEWLVAMQYAPQEGATIAVFKMPAAKVHELRTLADWDDPHFDDYNGPADPFSGASATAQPTRRTRKAAAATETTIAHASEKTDTGKLPHDEEAQAEAERNEQYAAAGQLVDVDISHDHATHDAAADLESGTPNGAEITGDDDGSQEQAYTPPAFITGGVASNFAAETNAAVAQEEAATATKPGRGRPRKAQISTLQGEASKHVETGDELPAWATLGLKDAE